MIAEEFREAQNHRVEPNGLCPNLCSVQECQPYGYLGLNTYNGEPISIIDSWLHYLMKVLVLLEGLSL